MKKKYGWLILGTVLVGLTSAVGSVGASPAAVPVDNAVENAKISSLKANMLSLQTIVETYGYYNQGIYPPNLETLMAHAQDTSNGAVPYWKDYSNPYTEDYSSPDTGKNKTENWLKAYSAYKPGPESAGFVLYEVKGEAPHIRYWIYGTDKSGQLLQVDGEPFIVSNE